MNATSRTTPAASRLSFRLRAGVVGVATAAALAVAGPAIAPAAPLVEQNTMTLPDIPYDAELAAAVRMLKDAGVDRLALEAAQAIITSAGQLSMDQLVARGVAVPAADNDPLAILKALGIQTLTPSVAPFCTTPTSDNPLGLVTAGAGAVPGPWPLAQEPLAPLQQLFGVELPKLNLVEGGQTAYAFVPATTTAGTGGNMQVAWFNTSTMQGGFADLKPLTDGPVLKLLPLLSGVRLAPVDTGKGTILSAVFGTAQNGANTCFFLPAVGVIDA
ncbi:hypothetical protein [Gordonia rhizosphera]|uniref:Uncharacterized protein n=1 Tax=Gordonia rhizosphera NBRC 16068 TaxID=1108045 RepID=K6VW13_9ACTN|nr:hypothetical protein [Gordonia rhizosphera]GAB91100.1 hypothetical protein GORHZ_123_00450 [Gordonia rhizosphera NBRC 16068]